MKCYYENKEEDKKAFDLINISDCENLFDLENIFEQNNIPFRERYHYYFLGKLHNKDTEKGNEQKTEKSEHTYFGPNSDWWEKYLKYYRPVKLKIRSEIHPELPKLEFPEVVNISKEEDLHIPFIKKGYFYKRQMDKSFMDMVYKDINAECDITDAMSDFEVTKELEKINEQYDTYKLKQIKNQSRYTQSQWCSACHESPCMCSDPF